MKWIGPYFGIKLVHFLPNNWYLSVKVLSVDGWLFAARPGHPKVFGFTKRCCLQGGNGESFDLLFIVQLWDSYRYSVLPTLSLNGMLECLIVEGSFNAARFYCFILSLLKWMNPFPGPNSIIVIYTNTLTYYLPLKAGKFPSFLWIKQTYLQF